MMLDKLTIFEIRVLGYFKEFEAERQNDKNDTSNIVGEFSMMHNITGKKDKKNTNNITILVKIYNLEFRIFLRQVASYLCTPQNE